VKVPPQSPTLPPPARPWFWPIKFLLRPAVHLPLAKLNARWQSRWGEVGMSWETHEDRKILAVARPAEF